MLVVNAFLTIDGGHRRPNATYFLNSENITDKHRQKNGISELSALNNPLGSGSSNGFHARSYGQLSRETAEGSCLPGKERQNPTANGGLFGPSMESSHPPATAGAKSMCYYSTRLSCKRLTWDLARIEAREPVTFVGITERLYHSNPPHAECSVKNGIGGLLYHRCNACVPPATRCTALFHKRKVRCEL